MIFFLYNALLHLALPFLLLNLWRRGRKAPAYRTRVAERFGFNAIQLDKSLWIHAVSMGEFLAALPLIQQLQQRYPDLPIVVTTMTPTGSAQVTAKLGNQIHHCYLPYDYAWAQQRLFRQFNPKILLIMETELWPNLIRVAKQRQVPTLLINARLSEKSAKGYQRFASLTHSVLQDLSHIAVQAQADADRFIQLGYDLGRMTVTGSIKSDVVIGSDLQQRAAQIKQHWGKARATTLAASTHAGEDEIVLNAFKLVQQYDSDSLLVLVPRHPERFDQVAELIREFNYSMVRRSEVNSGELDSSVKVVLGDTMGELMPMFGACDAAFVGGSLVSNGGHNILEPIAWSVPVVVGPSMFNFQTLYDQLRKVQGVIEIEDANTLGEAWLRLLSDTEGRQLQCQQAAEVLADNQGALEQCLELIHDHLQGKSGP